MRIFISYARKDGLKAAKEIYERLDGYTVFFDETEIGTGDNINDRIKWWIAGSDLFLALISEKYRERPSTQFEIKTAKEKRIDILPLWIERKEFDQEHDAKLFPEVLREDLDNRFPTTIDKGIKHIKEKWPILTIHNYVIEGFGKDNSESKNSNKPPNPYRGLKKFDPQDHKYFLGRNEDIVKLEDDLESSNFVTVVGPSGVGKSSLILAGLIPKLHSLTGKWIFTYFRPQDDPFGALASALIKLQPNDSDILRLGEELANGSDYVFSEILARIQNLFPEKKILIFIDQFERIFANQNSDNTHQAFLGNLTNYIRSHSSSRIKWIVTTTFYGWESLYSYPELLNLLVPKSHQLKPIGGEDDKSLKQIITTPAQRFDVEIDDKLIDKIIRVVQNKPDGVVLLEFFMWKLWPTQIIDPKTKKIRILDPNTELEKILATHVELRYNSLSSENKNRVRRIFLRLTHTADGVGRILPRVALLSEINGFGDNYSNLVRILSSEDNRLLKIGQNDKGETTVEIIHEALINHWRMIKELNSHESRKEHIYLEDLDGKAKKWEKDPNKYIISKQLLEDAKKFIQGLKNKGEDIPDRIGWFLTASENKKNKPWLFFVFFLVLLPLMFIAYQQNSNQKLQQAKRKEYEDKIAISEAKARLSSGEKQFIDTNSFKRRGISFFERDKQKAIVHFKVAKDLVKNDPETLIYLNNAIALQGVQEKHLTIAVSVPIAINRQVAQEILRGVAQAQDDWNKKWKECANNGNEKYKDCKIQKPLQVIIASDDNDNEIAKNIARYLVDEDRKENVLAVIGHNASNVSNAVLDIYQSKKLVMISPTSFAMNHHRIINSLIDNKNYIYTMSPPIKSLIRRIKDEIIKDSGKGGVRVLFCYDSRADDQKLIKKHFYEGNDEIKLKIFPEAHAVGNDKDVYKENIDECNYNNPINHQNLIEYAKEKEIKSVVSGDLIE